MKAVDVIDLIEDLDDDASVILEVGDKYYDIVDCGYRPAFGAHVFVAHDQEISQEDD